MNGIDIQYNRVREEEKENRSTPKPLKISAILKLIDDEILVVPEFQRDFEWNLDRFVLLFDSIYRGYTIGNLLLWRTNKKLAHKTIGSEKTKTVDQIENKEYTYVLDGQQRLTTIYGVLRGKKISRNGNKPILYTIYFDIKNDEFIKETQKISDLGGRTIKQIIRDGDFDKFRFINLSHIFNEDLNFPDNLIKEEERKIDSDLYAGKITPDEHKAKKGDLESKKTILEKFSKILKSYEIPQIVDYNNDIDKVVTVFERINTQNMKLDIYDIMVAKTYENILYEGKQITFNLNRAKHKLLYKNELKPDQLNPLHELPKEENLYYSLNNVTLLRLLSIFLNRDKGIHLQKKDIYNLTAQQIQDNILDFKKKIFDLHSYLKNQININDIDESYTNNNLLSFLIYVFSRKSYREINHELINLWFWNSLVFNRFPGAQLQLIEKDAQMYDEGEESFKKTILQRRNLDIFNRNFKFKLEGQELIDAGYNKVNSKLYQASILLLNSLRPKDFDGKHEIELADYIGNKTKNNKHHIIPYNSEDGKELRKKYGKEGENVINNIANIALISAELNQKISKKNPRDYFKEFESNPNFKEILKTHLIDEQMYLDLKEGNYEKFLSARTKKIIELICEKTRINEDQLYVKEENGN